MGKYYKTNTVPIVDYSIKYPFRELMQAEMYKQKRGDMAMDALDKKRQDLIDFKATPGQIITNADGTTTYQKSPDEQVLDTKREEYNSFVEGMRGKDLAKNYSAIRQGINGLYDPALADIKKSREAYDLEQTEISAMDKKGEWDPYGWTDPAGYDTATQGIYKGTAKPFFNYRPNAEKIFDKAVADSYIDPRTGLLTEELNPEKLQGLARAGSDSFMADPKNKRAIDKHLGMMDPTERANWEASYGKEGMRKRAAQQMLYDVGMEKWNTQVTMPKKSSTTSGSKTGSTGTTTAAATGGANFASTKLVQELVNNDGTGTVDLMSGGVESLLDAPASKRKNGYYDVQTEGEDVLIGNMGAGEEGKIGMGYIDVLKNGETRILKVGDKSEYLNATITQEDIIDQESDRQLRQGFESASIGTGSVEDYQVKANKLRDLKHSYNDLLTLGNSEEIADFSPEDVDLQKSIMQGIKMQGSGPAGYYTISPGKHRNPKIYRMPDGTLKHFIGEKQTTTHGDDVTRILLDEEEEFLKTAPAGMEVLTPAQAKEYLVSKDKWGGDIEIKAGTLKEEIDELEASTSIQKEEYAKLLQEYRGKGLLDPNSDASVTRAKAYREWLNSRKGGSELTNGMLAGMTGKNLFGSMNYDFRPARKDNVVTVGGKLYMKGNARFTDEELKNIGNGGEGISGEGEDKDRFIEGTSGHRHWFWNATSGKPGDINIEDALLASGIAERTTWNDDNGDTQTGIDIKTYIPMDFKESSQHAYNRSQGMTDTNKEKYQTINDKQVENLLRQNTEKQANRQNRQYRDTASRAQNKNLTGLAENIANAGLWDVAKRNKMHNTNAKEFFEVETDRQLMGETIQEWKDYIGNARKEDWGSIDFVSKNIEPSLKVLEDFLAFPRDINSGGDKSVAQAIQNLSNMAPVLMDPMGVKTAGKFGMTSAQAENLGALQKQNYDNYKVALMKSALPDVVQEMNVGKTTSGGLVPSEALDEYKSIGVDVAKMNNMTKITSTNTDLAIDADSTYVPYVAPEFVNTLKSIGDLGLGSLEISGALRMPAYERNLGTNAQSGAFISGRGVGFSLDTPAKKKAADALKVAITERSWGGTYGGKSISIPAGYHLTFKEIGNPPVLQVTLEEG